MFLNDEGTMPDGAESTEEVTTPEVEETEEMAPAAPAMEDAESTEEAGE